MMIILCRPIFMFFHAVIKTNYKIYSVTSRMAIRVKMICYVHVQLKIIIIIKNKNMLMDGNH